MSGQLDNHQQYPFPIFRYPVIRNVEPGAQCGLYSVLAASTALGCPTPISKVISGKYMPDPHGCTAMDLVRAASDFGLAARVYPNLDLQSLRESRSPMLLLFGKSLQAEQSLHWVCFLGFSNGKAVIYDPVQGINHYCLAVLAASWNGIAVVVYKEPNGCPRLGLGTSIRRFARFTPPICFVVCVVILRRPVSSCRRETGIRLQRFGAYVGFVGLWLCISITTDPTHPLRNAELARYLFCQSDSKRVELIPPDLVSGNDVLVDVRLPGDYSRGHISDAIHLPIDCSYEEFQQLTHDVSHDARIITYCQSSRCQWAEIMARRLSCYGYDAHVLNGGYECWQSELGYGN